MRSLVYVPLLCVIALGAREAVGMLVCRNTNFCEAVECADVNRDNCQGEIRPNATVCGCCTGCITIIPEGDFCPALNGRRRPGTQRTWECAAESVCINFRCTNQESTSDTTPE